MATPTICMKNIARTKSVDINFLTINYNGVKCEEKFNEIILFQNSSTYVSQLHLTTNQEYYNLMYPYLCTRIYYVNKT